MSEYSIDFEEIHSGQKASEVARIIMSNFTQVGDRVVTLQEKVKEIENEPASSSSSAETTSYGAFGIQVSQNNIVGKVSSVLQTFVVSVTCTYSLSEIFPGSGTSLTTYSYELDTKEISDSTGVVAKVNDVIENNALKLYVTVLPDKSINSEIELTISFNDTLYTQKIGILIISAKESKDGQSVFLSTIYKRSSSSPMRPTGGTFENPYPDSSQGWTKDIPSGTTDLYSSVRTFTNDGELPQDETWSTPALMQDNVKIDICYSAYSGETAPPSPSDLGLPHGKRDDTSIYNWHDEGTSQDRWMATSTMNSSTWSEWSILKIKGEKGDKGTSFNLKGTKESYEDLFNTEYVQDGDSYILFSHIWVYSTGSEYIYYDNLTEEEQKKYNPEGKEGFPNPGYWRDGGVFSGEDGKDGKDGISISLNPQSLIVYQDYETGEIDYSTAGSIIEAYSGSQYVNFDIEIYNAYIDGKNVSKESLSGILETNLEIVSDGYCEFSITNFSVDGNKHNYGIINFKIVISGVEYYRGVSWIINRNHDIIEALSASTSAIVESEISKKDIITASSAKTMIDSSVSGITKTLNSVSGQTSQNSNSIYSLQTGLLKTGVNYQSEKLWLYDDKTSVAFSSGGGANLIEDEGISKILLSGNTLELLSDNVDSLEVNRLSSGNLIKIDNGKIFIFTSNESPDAVISSDRGITEIEFLDDDGNVITSVSRNGIQYISYETEDTWYTLKLHAINEKDLQTTTAQLVSDLELEVYRLVSGYQLVDGVQVKVHDYTLDGSVYKVKNASASTFIADGYYTTDSQPKKVVKAYTTTSEYYINVYQYSRGKCVKILRWSVTKEGVSNGKLF